MVILVRTIEINKNPSVIAFLASDFGCDICDQIVTIVTLVVNTVTEL